MDAKLNGVVVGENGNVIVPVPYDKSVEGKVAWAVAFPRDHWTPEFWASCRPGEL
jgi:hypothetical protein